MLVGLAAGDAVTVIIVVAAVAWSARKSTNMLGRRVGGCMVKDVERYRLLEKSMTRFKDDLCQILILVSRKELSTGAIRSS